MYLLMARFTLRFVFNRNNGSLLGYDSCTDGVNELLQVGQQRIAPESVETIQCNLTGMIPETNHRIEVFGDDVLIYSINAVTSVADERPEAGDTSPVLFALGAIVLSLIALLSFAKWNDTKLGRTKSKLAHFYVAPALLSLAILTFYPVIYGFWLAFTDANQTQLGDQSFIGFDNFWEVFASDGFLRVTLFTLVWTVVNVSAHIGIGFVPCDYVASKSNSWKGCLSNDFVATLGRPILHLRSCLERYVPT